METTTMEYFLIDYDVNFSGKLDIRGFCIMSHIQKDLYFSYFKKLIEKYNSYCHCVGSDIELEYFSFDVFMKSFSWQKISLEEKKTLEFLFGIQSFIGDDPDIGSIPDDQLKENHNFYGHFPWDDFSEGI